MFAHFKAALLALGLLAPVAFAAQPPIDVVATNRATPIDFDADILPLLKSSCISCHNKTTSKGELNVETPDLIRRGGESGPGIKPGKGIDSLIVRVAAHREEPHMPPKDNKVKAPDLTPAQLGLLRQWIDEGAKASASSEHKIAWEPVPDSFSGIYAAALTRDGHYAACSRGGQIFVYHIPTRKLVAQLTDDALALKTPALKNGIAHRDSIPSLAFSPDGKRLASGSFREIKIWLRDDGITTQQLPADATRKTELAAKAPPASGTTEFDVPATKQKLTVTKDGTITLWDTEKKTKVRDLKHGAEINAAAASVNTDRIATSGVTNTVKIWDVANGVMIAEVKGERAATDAASEAARTSDFLTSETTYRKSDITNGEAELKKVEDRIKKINEDTKTAQTNVEAKIKLRDEAAKVKADTEKATPVPANFDVPDEATQKIRNDAATKLADAVKKFTEAESLVVRAKDSVTNLQNDLKNANEQIVKQTKAIADAKAAALAAEQLQKTAEADAKKALDAANVQQKNVRALVFSPDGSQLATAADDGLLHVWSAIDGTALRTLPGCGPVPTSLRTLTWDASGITATADDGSRVVHSFATRWTLERTLGGAASPLKDRVNALRFSIDGKALASGSGDYSRSGDVAIWNVESGALIKALPDLHKDSVLALCYSPDGKMLATAGSDRVAKIIDTTTWAPLKTFEGHTNHVLGISWRGDGRTLVSSGADGAVKIWDVASGEKKKSVDGWESEVTAIQHVGRTGNFLTASGDKRVRLLNDAGAEVKAFAGGVDFMQCAAASADGTIILAGGQDGVLRVWDGAGKVLVVFPSVP